MKSEVKIRMRYRKTPIIFWLFTAIRNLIEFIFKMTGRLVAVLLGLVIMIIGIALCFTIIGAIVGVPLAIFGIAMVVRGFF